MASPAAWLSLRKSSASAIAFVWLRSTICSTADKSTSAQTHRRQGGHDTEERRRTKTNEEERRGLTGFAKEHGGAAVDLDLLSVARRERAVDGPAQGIPFRDRTKAFS
jgi:hypothetical protein